MTSHQQKTVQRYLGILENQTVYVVRFLPGGTLTFVNSALASITGLEPEQLLGQSFYQFIHEEDRAHAVRTIESLTPEAPFAVLENRVTLADGAHWHQWEHRALFDEDGSFTEYQATGRDITRLKQLEKSLRESEARYRSVVENQTEIITRYLPDGRSIFVNECYCRFFGVPADQALRETWLCHVFPEDIPLVEHQLCGMSAGNPVVAMEVRVFSASCELRWVQFVNRGFYDEQGQLVQTQAVGRDVTDRKEAEEILKRYMQRLITQEEDLRSAIAMELHDDVGQELTALALDLSHIRATLDGRSDDDPRPVLADAMNLARTINKTARDLMVSLRPTQLEQLGLAEAIRCHAERFKKRSGIAVSLSSAEEFPRLKIDQELALFRITQEALNNVLKHAEATRVSIVLEHDHGRPTLTISDNGKGFRLQELQRQKDRFGWGITTMRERAKMIRGSFMLESAPGAGTTITVEL